MFKMVLLYSSSLFLWEDFHDTQIGVNLITRFVNNGNEGPAMNNDKLCSLFSIIVTAVSGNRCVYVNNNIFLPMHESCRYPHSLG